MLNSPFDLNKTKNVTDYKKLSILDCLKYLLLEYNLVLRMYRISDIEGIILRSFLQIFEKATHKMMCLQ